jgi:hypothetical protein
LSSILECERAKLLDAACTATAHRLLAQHKSGGARRAIAPEEHGRYRVHMDQTVRIVVPVGSPAAVATGPGGTAAAVAPRSAWLLHNGKALGDVVLRALGEELTGAGWDVRLDSKQMPSSPCPEDLLAVGVGRAGALTALSD